MLWQLVGHGRMGVLQARVGGGVQGGEGRSVVSVLRKCLLFSPKKRKTAFQAEKKVGALTKLQRHVRRAASSAYYVNKKMLSNINRVGQNRIYTPYMTEYSVISLPKIPYIHRIYMVLANPKHKHEQSLHV
jgi:hypothetical protein